MAESTGTWPHQDLITDNKITVTELSQKTQDLISKFSGLTDKDAQEAMDEKIYGQIEDHIEAKATEAKKAKTKEKVEAHKKNKLDVSKAGTAKTPEQELAEKQAAEAAATPKTRSLMDFAFGRK